MTEYSTSTLHVPVLLKEAVDALAVKPGGRYVDGTLGRAGHAREIIARGGSVLGIDRDAQALEEVGGIEGLVAVRGRHGDIKEIADEHGWNEVDGVLLDLGVSSPQLDDAGRGFSFLREGPLDMRMDRSSQLTAADIVNTEGEEALAAVFRGLGEEPRARHIARAIVRRRESKGRIETTTELADVVAGAVGRSGPRHPATRVFQALRMAVNDELGELDRAQVRGDHLRESQRPEGEGFFLGACRQDEVPAGRRRGMVRGGAARARGDAPGGGARRRRDGG